MTPAEHRLLAQAMAGREAYPLSQPVDLLVPQREVKPPYDNYSFYAFSIVTREGTAGVIRMTAQVTDTRMQTGKPLQLATINTVRQASTAAQKSLSQP